MLTLEQIKNLTKEEVAALADGDSFRAALNIRELELAYSAAYKLRNQIIPLAEALSRRAEEVGLNPTSSWDDREDEFENEEDVEISNNLYDEFENLASTMEMTYGDTIDTYGDMAHEFWVPSTC